MDKFGFSVLKGRHILAQGKRRRSVALGLGTGFKIVRAIMFFEIIVMCRTKRHESQFRPKENICFDNRILADDFSSAFLTQGGVSDRSSRNSTVLVPIISGCYNMPVFQT